MVCRIPDHIFSESQSDALFPQKCDFPPQREMNSYSYDTEMHPGWPAVKPGEVRKARGWTDSSQYGAGASSDPCPQGPPELFLFGKDPSTSTSLDPERSSQE